jgi:hypothetical protein
MITISGLTNKQVKLLDKMWNIQGYDAYMEWKGTLRPKILREVEVFEKMITLAELDNEVEDLTDARMVLDKIALK